MAESKLKQNLQQQILLADISQNLNCVKNISERLNATLKLLGRHTKASRIYIFEDSADGLSTSNTYEWCADGIAAKKDLLQQVPYEMIPSCKKILLEYGRILCTDINKLPDDMVKALARQNIKSLLVFPLYVQENFFGFIGFDECIAPRQWETDETELLRTVANIIAGTFERGMFYKQLGESEARLKMAIENTEAGLWDWNIVTGHVYFSDIWCKMLGYAQSEIEPNVSTWEKLVHPDDLPSVTAILEKHLSGQTPDYRAIHRLRTKTGEWKWISDSGRIIERDGSGKPVRAIGTHIDIDSQKRTEEELRIANATKDKFFSIIAHDLRGPIGRMMQISELISTEDNIDEPTLRRFIESQKVTSRNTFQLLENLLQWARYNSDQIQCNPAVINLNDIIRDSLEDVKFETEKKSIIAAPSYDAQFTAYADEDMVRLIIRNLLTNALKFTPPKGNIRVEVEHDGAMPKVSVINTGKGIPQEDIARILSDYDFYSTYGTQKEKGSGLGLKLCKNFIALNHGKLTIESVPDKETSFSFTLPADAKSVPVLNKAKR